MELPYKIKIINSLTVKIGYSLLMLSVLSVSVFLLINVLDMSKYLNLISVSVILTTVSYVIFSTMYRLFTEVIISDDLIEINNLFNKYTINKNEIIGYQGGLCSYVDPKLRFRNFSYSKYIFTTDKRIFLFIEDNKSAHYFNNSDEKRPIEVIDNINKQLVNGLKIKPVVLKGTYTLLFISFSMLSGWYLSLNKINELDRIIILSSGIFMLGYSLIRIVLFFYTFIIKKTNIVLYEDKMKISDRWKNKLYSYKEIKENNKELFFIKYNNLLKLIIGKYLFNGNEYITNRVFF